VREIGVVDTVAVVVIVVGRISVKRKAQSETEKKGERETGETARVLFNAPRLLV
jgi:hypothetical protein